MGVQIVSTIFAGPDAEPALREDMGQVANLLTATSTKRLIDLLTNWSCDVWSAECGERIAPSRVEALNELMRFERSVLNIYEILQFSHAATYLRDVPDDLSNLQLILAASARRARHSPTFVSKDGKVRRGAGKAVPTEQASSKSMCAAIVAEIWAFYHDGEYPAPTNETACRAAHLLFHSHKATRKASWGIPENGWKRHFNKIDDQNLISLRDEVRRLLTIVKFRDAEHN